MANKSAIDAIFADITTGGANTAVEALACWNALKDELYPTPVLQDTSTITIIERNYTSITHSLYFTKGGNKAKINGSLSVSGGMASFTNMFDFTDAVYKPRTGLSQYVTMTRLDTGDTFALLLEPSGSGFLVNTQNLFNGVTYHISGEYLTNN